jgi:putative chitinase
MLANLLKAILSLFQRPAPGEVVPVETQDAQAFPISDGDLERCILAAGGDNYSVPVQRIAEAFKRAFIRYGITEPLVAAHLIAQVGHESGGFRFTREIWRGTQAQLRYEGNRNLGNNQPGDGRRFAGLFWLQLTGRWNHTAYATYRGIDVDKLPLMADDIDTNADVACWYILINRKSFIVAAKRNDPLAASIAVNGVNANGLPNGYEDRLARTRAVLRVLGIPE